MTASRSPYGSRQTNTKSIERRLSTSTNKLCSLDGEREINEQINCHLWGFAEMTRDYEQAAAVVKSIAETQKFLLLRLSSTREIHVK